MARKRDWPSVVAILAAWGVRLLWLTEPGYAPDVGFFVPWMRLAAQHGPVQIFALSDSSYPPLSVYLLAALGYISPTTSMELAAQPVELLFLRTAIILFDLLLVALLYQIGRRTVGYRTAAIAAFFYALLPGSVYLSGWWAQTDAWFLLPMVAAVYLLAKKRVAFAWALLGMAISFKIQAVVILPVFIVGTWRWYGFKRLSIGLTVMAIILALVLLPLVFGGQLDALTTKTTETLRELPWITAQAHNGWYAFAPEARSRGLDINSDWNVVWGGVSFRDAGLILLAFGYGSLLVRLFARSGPRAVYAAVGLAWFMFFMLPTRIHARYLLPVPIFLLMAGFYQWRYWILTAVTAATLSFNLFFHTLPQSPWRDAVSLPPELGVANAWLNVLAFLLAFIWFLQPMWQPVARQEKAEGALYRATANWEKALLVLGGIVLFVGGGTILGQGYAVGRDLAEWTRPLPASLQMKLADFSLNEPILIVNWPRMVWADGVSALGVLPVTPPAAFLPLPETMAPQATWVQYPPWQVEMDWELSYHGRFLTQDELATAVYRSQTVLAFNPHEPEMVTLLQRQPNTTDSCPILFAGQICLTATAVSQSSNSVQTQLSWQVRETIDPNVTVFVHVMDETGQLVAQNDGDPGLGLVTFADLAGTDETVLETRLIPTTTANNTVHIGLYNRLTGERLSIQCADNIICSSDAATFRP